MSGMCYCICVRFSHGSLWKQIIRQNQINKVVLQSNIISRMENLNVLLNLCLLWIYNLMTDENWRNWCITIIIWSWSLRKWWDYLMSDIVNCHNIFIGLNVLQKIFQRKLDIVKLNRPTNPVACTRHILGDDYYFDSMPPWETYAFNHLSIFTVVFYSHLFLLNYPRPIPFYLFHCQHFIQLR